MVESAQISPHVHTVYKVDMTRIVRLREREKGAIRAAQWREAHLHAVYRALRLVEDAAQVSDRQRVARERLASAITENINLGIAVALEWGLIVPVVKQAEDRSFLGLARAIADLAERARAKKLKPEEAIGSTFTLTNSGMFGDEFGMPIINQPEAAILAIGGLNKEAGCADRCRGQRYDCDPLRCSTSASASTIGSSTAPTRASS